MNVLLIFTLSYLAPYLKLIDIPNERKIHDGNIPLVGGLTIYLSLILFFPFMSIPFWLAIIIFSAGIIVLFGAIDDALQLGISIRLISQIIAGLIVVGSGLTIVDIGGYMFLQPIKLGIFGILLSLLCVVGLTNAINFMDGIDGLSSGLTLISLFSIYVFSIFDGGLRDGNILVILGICLLIFFIFNMGFVKINKIFLGDSGSMMLGYILAWMLIYYSHPNTRSIHPVLTLWCVTLPVFDLLGVILRRISNKINPFKPDRRHLHHLLLQSGLSYRSTLLMILFMSLSSSIFGITIYKLFGPGPALLSFLFLFIGYIIFSFNLSNKLIKNL